MDTQLYIKILIVQAYFLHCFFACFTLFFFGFSERRNLWNCEWNCERFTHNGLNHLCATDFRQMLALFKEGFRNFSASYKDMIQ